MGESFLSDDGTSRYSGGGNPARRPSVFKLLLIAVAALTALVWFAPTGVQTPGRVVILDGSRYCGESKLAAWRAHKAIQAADWAAVLGMVDRGEILALDAGARVRTFHESDGHSTVHVQSGYHSGRRCWIPTLLLDQ